MSKSDELEYLIEDIYAAALQPARWPGTLGRVAALTGSRDAIMQGLRFREKDHEPLFIISNQIDPEALTRHAMVVAEVGELRVEALRTFPIGRVVQDPDFVSPATIATHPYYQDLLVPFGYKYCAQVATLIEPTDDGEVIMGFGLQRTETQGLLTTDAREAFHELLPHLHRALRITRKLNPSFPAPLVKPTGIASTFGLNRRGRVIATRANPGSRPEPEPGSVREASGRLLFPTLEAERRVGAAIAAAVERRTDTPLSGYFVANGQRWIYSVIPIANDEGLLDTLADTRVAVELTIQRTSSSREKPRITPAERRLIASLATGRRLRDAAADVGIAYETGRSHLKRVMEKLGIHSQAALVAAWLTSPEKF